jgi:DNA-binding LytR/AlgR family response regulator
MTISTYAVELGMSSIFSDGLSVEHAAEKLPVNLILNVVFETLYITFVLPVAISSLKTESMAEPDAQVAECKNLTIAGKIFLCADLVSVSAQDHYVLVRTGAGETMMRARLADLIGQLNCRNGIQPHRSHWVTRDAVAEMVSQEGHKLLKMKDGSLIPIARGRVVDVRRWLEI